MAKSSFSLLIIFSLFFLSLNPVKADSVHELLQSKGLPAGLLPKDVKSYSLEDDGRLEVHLDQPCYAKFDGMVYYDRVVRGNLSYGELTGVAGFSQEELFLWLPVKGIKMICWVRLTKIRRSILVSRRADLGRYTSKLGAQ
ncbi:uncharacterized protein LOC18449003 isoform X2 [Amborella trichopoda]|uniref:Uncharacterized protein n=1 Tax=Amborella trichopoda TaxID=13333 RepID=U5DEF2_AMBTC|nr:uncharacterized protein LOC18449003 isoform X2 [Amborella trichopoda]ERN20580.1 hypothetical protein AMTR_s00070p00063680 [Amborella trichopoda]|eukprot:XP_006859113.1 uncharacterized protein LOC18449003 isoform X2 [Amborella trichopoda]